MKPKKVSAKKKVITVARAKLTTRTKDSNLSDKAKS